MNLVFFPILTCRLFWKATTEFKAFEQIVSFNRLHEATIEEQQKKKENKNKSESNSDTKKKQEHKDSPVLECTVNNFWFSFK